MTRPWSLLALLALLAAGPARADIQKGVPEDWPGKNMLQAHLGFQSGMVGYGIGGASPTGFKLSVAYDFRFTDMFWFDAGVNFLFGGTCSGAGFQTYACGSASNGWTVEPSAGVMATFKTPIPLVPYAKADAQLIGIYERFCSDNGVGITLRIAGGANYYLLKNLSVGADLGFTFGPAYYEGTNQCVGYYYGSHWEFYNAVEFNLGGTWVF